MCDVASQIKARAGFEMGGRVEKRSGEPDGPDGPDGECGSSVSDNERTGDGDGDDARCF